MPLLTDLNRDLNGADVITLGYAAKTLNEFDGYLTAVEMGIAYGGEMESLGKLYKRRGHVYGFDTFEDLHPKHLTEHPFEQDCMDYYYTHPDYGTERLSIEYQREKLKIAGVDNVTLTKGEVGPDSCKDIEQIHFAFLDMDIYASMKNGYEAVKDKMVVGGYLLAHDAATKEHIESLYKLFHEEIRKDDDWMWEPPKIYHSELVLMLKRR